ncbi:MAG: DAK2 domain-containing protein, partial [Ktedonobacterales bacterium]
MARNFFSRLTRTRARPRRISVFDGQDLKRATLAAYIWLEQHREAINALNVYPVPDGDTGTNMTLTLLAATKEIAEASDTAACVIAEKLSRGALMGARGNSGSILSQILRGVSNGIEKKATLTANDFALALQDGARAAYRCVITPVEGTILTVVREAADAAHQSAMRGSDMVSMLDDTVRAAKIAVANTPDLLPKLKEAGVVDAGGQGLMTILEGMLRYTRGESLETAARPVSSTAALDEEFRKGMVDVEEDEYGYEVVFLLEGANLDVEGIRNTLTAMGGVSTVVAGDSSLLKVHTHTPTPGQILDYGVSLGSLQDINIENLQAQSERYAADSKRQRGIIPTAAAHAPNRASSAAFDTAGAGAAIHDAAQEARTIGTVAVVSGEGWVGVYRGFGATIVPGGQSMNPSTQELLEAVESCPSDQVILLPNNNNILMSAR